MYYFCNALLPTLVITNLYDFLSSVEHKRRYRESPVVPSVVLDSSEVIIDPA